MKKTNVALLAIAAFIAVQMGSNIRGNVKGDELYKQAESALNAGRNKEAVSLFKQAGENGNENAYYMLAEMYRTGRGVPKDNKKSQEYADKADEIENNRIDATIET